MTDLASWHLHCESSYSLISLCSLTLFCLLILCLISPLIFLIPALIPLFLPLQKKKNIWPTCALHLFGVRRHKRAFPGFIKLHNIIAKETSALATVQLGWTFVSNFQNLALIGRDLQSGSMYPMILVCCPNDKKCLLLQTFLISTHCFSCYYEILSML